MILNVGLDPGGSVILKGSLIFRNRHLIKESQCLLSKTIHFGS